MPVEINYFTVVAAAIISMVLGFIWYGPLFGKRWMAYVGIDPASIPRQGQTRGYIWQVVLSVVTAYVLARVVDHMAAKTFTDGIVAGFWVWLGFVATVSGGAVLYERRPFGLWVLNNAYQLVALAAMGALLAVWA